MQAVRWENIEVEDHHNYALVGPFTENTVDESQCHPIIQDSGEVADTCHTSNKMVGSMFKQAITCLYILRMKSVINTFNVLKKINVNENNKVSYYFSQIL